MPRGNKMKTTEQFLLEVEELYGDKFGYGKVVYSGSKVPVVFFCKKHGIEFKQTPNNFLRGHTCPECGEEERRRKRTWATEKFIEEARKVHGDGYDYSKVSYIKSSIPVQIICKRCGREFPQTPNSHLAGHGCKVCSYVDRGEKASKGKDAFVREARAIWGDAYIYDSVVYKNSKTRIEIICPEHGAFPTTPYKHLSLMVGCPHCKRESKLIYGVAINDAPDCDPKCKEVWMGMLHRCYYDKELERHPTYRGCSVCDEWLRLSGFVPFWETNYKPKYELEKDILVKGNKVYGPDTACFVPRRINILLTRRQRFRGALPIGVGLSDSGNRYSASYDRDGKSTLVGYYDSSEKAFYAYKSAKESYIKEVAQDYFDRGLITERVKDALFCYEVEITD